MQRLTIAVVATFSIAMACCSHGGKKPGHKLSEPERARRMQSLVIDLSATAKAFKPGFLIVPQNGSMLAFRSGNPTESINSKYLDAIDAIGIEALFYNGTFDPDSTRIGILQQLSEKKKILVSEFVTDQSSVEDVAGKNLENGFVPFVREAHNMHYEHIPKKIGNENSRDIKSVSDVKNYLYLINPSQFDSREAFIGAISKTNHDLVIIDLFFSDNQPFDATDLAKLNRKANGAKRLVLCYINIGAAESWRYYWNNSWKLGNPDFLARNYHGYSNEYWVEFWHRDWREILFGGKDSYLAKIASAGFDGAYLDNVEAYKYLYSE